MRVLVATESFLPQVNGVTNSVLRTLEHFEARGVEALVVAPSDNGLTEYRSAPIVAVPSLPLPLYSDVRVTVSTSRRLTEIIRQWRPDIVHLAGPLLLGVLAARAASQLGVPSVAVFQTDFAGFAEHYGVPVARSLAWRRIRKVHERAMITLAPSTSTARLLREHGIRRVVLWPRGVDTGRFSPARRDSRLRHRLAPDGRLLVGFVGRLAPEKLVEDLQVLEDLPGIRLVVVGEGPSRRRLQRQLPTASFLGFQGGHELAATMASLDVFVHPGESETFCQAAQEALASGVPVVAPGTGGLLDLVRPSHNGWLYPPGDLRALRGYVADLVGDDAKRRAMGRVARASVRSRSWDRVGDDLIDHYRALIPVRR